MRKLVLAAAAAALVLGAGAAKAATDGQMGSTSTATLEIQMQVPTLVRIWKVQDIDLGSWDGTPVSGSSVACVFSNVAGPGVRYHLTATGSGAGGAFTIAEPGSETIPYVVEWVQNTVDNSGSVLTSGTAFTTTDSTSITNPACMGGTNAQVFVRVTQSIIDSLSGPIPAETYSGTLTLLVEAP